LSGLAMGLTKFCFGDLIEPITEINSELQYTADDVRGMTIYKEIIPTKADVENMALDKFIIIKPREFVYNPRTHGKRIGLGYNNTGKSFIISWNNIGFKIREKACSLILADYLFMNLKRDEWDREACVNSWGSSTEVFSWDSFCDMEISLPPLSVQQKYVNIYKAMVENQKTYERGLEDLKLVCDGYIEDLRRRMPCERIGQYIRECNERNDDLSVVLTQGIDVNMQFIPAKREAADKESTRIVRDGQFAFNKVVKSNGTKLPIALRQGPDCIISGSYQVFEVVDKKCLLPEYLMMWMSRPETQRYCGFNAWGSTRDVFDFGELSQLEIPVPDIKVQQAIADIYNVYVKRREINERLKQEIKEICPILVKGALEEGARSDG